MSKTTRTNTPTEQNKEDNQLVLYRLKQVEIKQDVLLDKFDRMETLKPSDLKNFQETIVTRFLDMSNSLQKQIDEVKTEKADKQELSDFKKLVFGVFAFGQSIVLLVLGYLISTR